VIRGEISNEVPPRFIITWDVLAALSEEAARTEKWARKLKRWDKAVSCWEIDRTMVNRMWLAEKRYGIRWELAVFDRGRDFCDAVAERLDAENIPVAIVRAFVSALALADSLAYRPDIMGVVDIPARFAHYGARTVDPRSM
jgi:hypothetical protein